MHTNLTVPSNLAHQLADALNAGYTTEALCLPSTLDAQYGTDSHAPVDFVSLYPSRKRRARRSEELADHRLTPRQAFALHQSAVTYLEYNAPLDFDQDADTWSLTHELPRACRPFLNDPVWITQLHHVFHVIAGQLATGQTPHPRSTAEIMALDLIITDAKDSVRDRILGDIEEYEKLPNLTDDDAGFDDIRTWLLPDTDVLMLLKPALDGIENDDTADTIGARNLHPSRWFIPFLEEDAIHADLALPVHRLTTAPLTVRLEVITDYVVTDPYALIQAAVETDFESTHEELDGIDLLQALPLMSAETLTDVCAEAIQHLAHENDIDGANFIGSTLTAYQKPLA